MERKEVKNEYPGFSNNHVGAIIIPAYIFYLYLKKKELDQENEEMQTSQKILSALKEYAKQQPDFAKILSKFGLL